MVKALRPHRLVFLPAAGCSAVTSLFSEPNIISGFAVACDPTIGVDGELS